MPVMATTQVMGLSREFHINPVPAVVKTTRQPRPKRLDRESNSLHHNGHRPQVVAGPTGPVPCHCTTNAWLQSASQKEHISRSTSRFYSLLFSFFFLSRFRFFIFLFLTNDDRHTFQMEKNGLSLFSGVVKHIRNHVKDPSQSQVSLGAVVETLVTTSLSHSRIQADVNSPTVACDYHNGGICTSEGSGNP
jgi:hypothetical protein